MALNKRNFGGGIGGGSVCPNIYSFVDLDSTIEEISAPDYFLELFPILKKGDGIYCFGSDGSVMMNISLSTRETVTSSASVGSAIVSDTLEIIGATPLKNAFAITRTDYDANVPQSVKDDTSILIAIDETA